MNGYYAHSVIRETAMKLPITFCFFTLSALCSCSDPPGTAYTEADLVVGESVRQVALSDYLIFDLEKPGTVTEGADTHDSGTDRIEYKVSNGGNYRFCYEEASANGHTIDVLVENNEPLLTLGRGSKCGSANLFPGTAALLLTHDGRGDTVPVFVRPSYSYARASSSEPESNLTILISTVRCPDCNLSRLDLRGRHLEGVDFANADLSHSDLTGAYLQCANLSGANLSEAKLGMAWWPDHAVCDKGSVGKCNKRMVFLPGFNLHSFYYFVWDHRFDSKCTTRVQGISSMSQFLQFKPLLFPVGCEPPFLIHMESAGRLEDWNIDAWYIDMMHPEEEAPTTCFPPLNPRDPLTLQY